MREINGALRGLLKKSNRPAQHRKNRVVFDETRNEFFEADYIILIREDCAYSEEDEEPCSCGDHELVRICCEDGCQCNYENDDPKSIQSPKFAPPVGFVDEAALSPPDDYKDSSLKNAIAGSIGGHVFGAQHIQQLQVIQKLQQQRAAMLAARATNQNPQFQQNDENSQSVVCTECAECAECSSKTITDPIKLDFESFLPLTKSSPERRVTQKEIIAGEERPKYVKDEKEPEAEDLTESSTSLAKGADGKESVQKIVLPNSSSINGILKGGKLRKQDENQSDDANNGKSGSEDENPSFKRSVRFSSENDKDNKKGGNSSTDEGVINDLIPIKKHSTIFNNALRPNSAVRQLFPTAAKSTPALTHEALRAFDESKRGTTTISELLSSGSDTDSMRKTLERNTLRRSLLRKKVIKSDTSLEERIKLLTCDVDETSESSSEQQTTQSTTLSSETKVEDAQSTDADNNPDKFFSSCSSASSCSSSGSSQMYKKITEKLNADRKQGTNQEYCENPVVIIPQDCRCPAAPDLGIGIHVPVVHTQIHQTPLRQAEIKKQFLSSLAPLTSCVVGQKDDLSYYTLAEHNKNLSNSNDQNFNNNLQDQSLMYSEENSKVAPDVIAGTPGQENINNDIHQFSQQNMNKTDKNKSKSKDKDKDKETAVVNSDDDEQNDYGFNKRPTVRGIKTQYDSPNKILEEMQEHMSQPSQSEGIYKKITKANNPNESEHTNKSTEDLKTKTAPKNWPNYSDTLENKTITNPANQSHQAFSNYYPTLPLGYRQTFHEQHQQSMMYQNCHITTEKHISRYARSPSRRPESPPPMRNYHQTMVLIPYNSETCSQFTTTNTTGEHHIHRQNILEYQQVTQQTIRVPMGYSFPAMELHLVTGREQVNQFAQYPTILNAKTLNYTTNVLHGTPNFSERGVPEGAVANSETIESNKSPENKPVDSNNATGVFYAMNV